MRLSLLTLAALLATSGCVQPTTPEPQPIAAASAPDHHNARNALDWAGTYQGTLPCASCNGIKTTLTLQDNGHYRLNEVYLGNPETVSDSNGTFSWNEAGDTVTLFSENRRYVVAENQLIALNPDNSRPTGPLADAYILQKTR